MKIKWPLKAYKNLYKIKKSQKLKMCWLRCLIAGAIKEIASFFKFNFLESKLIRSDYKN